ncbi:aroma-sacti cluster domain-containing protein [Streptomyces sp. NPDC004579]|uniref:aroma-sacti cluster domain-containing protein n=1 Tax=Streptomyces sp. NPDC004579 TaxID=3154667 RepID=UPI0033B8F36C
MTDSAPDHERLLALEDAGFPLHTLSPEQREVLQDLSAQELTLLLDLKRRLDAAEPEVQAHSEIAGGALF